MSTSLTSSLFTSASPSSLKECQNLWRVHPVVSQQWEQKNKQLFQDFFGDPLGFFGFFMAGWWRTLPDALGFFCLAPPPLRLRLRLCCQLIAFTRFFFFLYFGDCWDSSGILLLLCCRRMMSYSGWIRRFLWRAPDLGLLLLGLLLVETNSTQI